MGFFDDIHDIVHLITEKISAIISRIKDVSQQQLAGLFVAAQNRDGEA